MLWPILAAVAVGTAALLAFFAIYRIGCRPIRDLGSSTEHVPLRVR